MMRSLCGGLVAALLIVAWATPAEACHWRRARCGCDGYGGYGYASPTGYYGGGRYSGGGYYGGGYGYGGYGGAGYGRYDFGRPGYGLGGPMSGLGVRPGLGVGGFGPGR